MAQAETVAIPKRLPLVVQPENRDESTAKDAKLLNAYVEKNVTTGELWVYKRPGLLQYGEAKAGVGLGIYNWLGHVYSIFGNTMYKDGVALVGVLDTAGGIYKFAQSLGATLRLQFGNGVATYNYDQFTGIVKIDPLVTVTAGSFVALLEYTILTVGTTDFVAIGAASNTIGVVFTATGVGAGDGTATTPNNFPLVCAKGIVYLDGTTYVMDPDASIRGCTTLNDPTLWTDVLNRLTAQIEADAGVFLAKQLVYVIALGQWSTEVFYDALNATASPLGPVQGAKINYGCVNGDTVQELDGALIWVATNRSASAQVVVLDNLKLQIVSTKAIERLLDNVDTLDLSSFAFKFEGHAFYGLTQTAENLTLVYDLTDKTWAQWTDADGNYWPIVSATYLAVATILQHGTNGKLYTMDSSYFTDDGEIITVDIYTPNFDGGVRRRKQLTMMEFIGDQTPGSVLQVRSNDWDYQADRWTNFRKLSLDVRKPTLANNGTFMRRAYHFRHQCNTRMRIQAIELQLDIGTL